MKILVFYNFSMYRTKARDEPEDKETEVVSTPQETQEIKELELNPLSKKEFSVIRPDQVSLFLQ